MQREIVEIAESFILFYWLSAVQIIREGSIKGEKIHKSPKVVMIVIN